jgi:hypothetical protein
VFTNGGGVDQSKNVENIDLREGSIIKGMTSGATARVTAYNGYGLGPGALDDEYEIELLHKITDKVYFKTDYRNSASRLEANKDFIKAEVVKFIQDKYPSLDFDANTCGRDVGYIVDAIVYDIRYGGNIRVYFSSKILKKNINKKEINNINKKELNYEKLFLKMNKNLFSWKKETRKYIINYVKKNGRFLAKAFPGRAAILIKLLKLNEKHIFAVYEIKNSIKVNHYVPGTRIPILPESELYSQSHLSKPILNLAWHLPREVRKNLLENDYKGKVIDIKKFKKI